MPEFVNIFFFRRKVKFDRIFGIIVISTIIGYYWFINANTFQAITEFYNYYNDWQIEHENGWRLFRAANTCLTRFSGADITQLRPLDWATFERDRRLQKFQTWWEPFYVNEKYKLLFCITPETASTNLMRHLIKVSQPPGVLKQNKDMEIEIDSLPVQQRMFASPYLMQLREYPKVKAMEFIENFTKFIWVRNPLDRLVSAWHSKLTQYDELLTDEFGSKMIRLHRANATVEEIKRGFPVNLEDFFKYLATFPLPTKAHPMYWRPIYEVCQFCNIRYDFIGKLENIDAELDYFVRRVMMVKGESEELSTLPKLAKPASLFDNKTDYLRQLPRELIERVLAKQQLDYAFFGYDTTADLSRIFDE